MQCTWVGCWIVQCNAGYACNALGLVVGLCSATQATPAMHLGWLLGLCGAIQATPAMHLGDGKGDEGAIWLLCSATQAAPAMHLGWLLGR